MNKALELVNRETARAAKHVESYREEADRHRVFAAEAQAQAEEWEELRRALADAACTLAKEVQSV